MKMENEDLISEFFNSLIKDPEERKIILMLVEGKSNEEILDELLGVNGGSK
jgi:DNA-binding CsgD family transcriptional regulator